LGHVKEPDGGAQIEFDTLAQDDKPGTDQQATTDTQEAAAKAAQAPQAAGQKPAVKSTGGLGPTNVTVDDGADAEAGDIALGAPTDASVLAALAAANMAAQPATTAGKELPASVDAPAAGVTGEQDPLLGGEEGGQTENLKDLFQLAAATDTSAKPESALQTGKDSRFGSMLNTALENQGNIPTPPSHPGMSTTAPTTQIENTRQVVATPVATQGWAEEVGQKVSWAAHNGNGRAELVLTPAHMGRIEVSINLNGDQASANFMAANAATREALQDAMPQLREVLANAGIQLGQANVSTNSGGQAWTGGSGQSSFDSGSYSGRDSGSVEVAGDVLTGHTRGAWIQSGNGLVDTFA